MKPRARRGPRPLTTDAYPTEVTQEDLAAIGAALVSSVASMCSLGHESPSGLADYVQRDGLPWQAQLVLDAVALSQTIGSSPDKEEALDRMSGFVWQTGWMHLAAGAVSS